MSGPVDVRAVLAQYWRRLDLPEDLLLARHAIEELIAADKEYDRVRDPASGCPLGVVLGAHRRRAAALANVGGAT